MTAVKFERQAGYRLPNHNSFMCCMLADFHSNDGACSTGKVIITFPVEHAPFIGLWRRFFSPGNKTVVVKTAIKRLGNRNDKIKNLC